MSYRVQHRVSGCFVRLWSSRSSFSLFSLITASAFTRFACPLEIVPDSSCSRARGLFMLVLVVGTCDFPREEFLGAFVAFASVSSHDHAPALLIGIMMTCVVPCHSRRLAFGGRSSSRLKHFPTRALHGSRVCCNWSSIVGVPPVHRRVSTIVSDSIRFDHVPR